MKGEVSSEILKLFEDGPGFIHDVSEEIGMPPRNVSANLKEMVKAGKLCRRKFHLDQDMGQPQSRKDVWIYALPEHAGWAG